VARGVGIGATDRFGDTFATGCKRRELLHGTMHRTYELEPKRMRFTAHHLHLVLQRELLDLL